MTDVEQDIEVGQKMPDGTVYAGSLDGKAVFATQTDAPVTYTFNEAAAYAAQLNAVKSLGHDDWRVPTKGELNVLFQNRAAIGGFNETGSYPAGWYWSSWPTSSSVAWAQCFSDGYQFGNRRNGDASLRLVR